MRQRQASVNTELNIRREFEGLLGISLGTTAVLAYSGSSRCRRKQRRADVRAIAMALRKGNFGTPRANGTSMRLTTRGHTRRNEVK